MIAAPVLINIPTAYAGNPITLQWSEVAGASGYALERSINGGSFAVVYSGRPANYTDYVPDIATTAAYRVWAWIGRGETWAERDAAAVDWATRDAAAVPWITEESDKTPYTFDVVPNRPPVISGQDSNLGTRYRGFDVTYSITDPDPNSTASSVVRIDSTVIQTVANVQLGTPYTATVTDAQVFAMQSGTVHTVTITATDNKGAVAVRTYTFTAVEDLVSTAVFYVLRDGIPIAKLESDQEWTDYLAAGTHSYKVRGVDKYDNFTDSNEVTVTVSLQHAQIALVEAPSDIYPLKIRRGERPFADRTYSTMPREIRFEGRKFPILQESGQRSQPWSLGYSSRTLRDQQRLLELIESGQLFVYRDQYDRIAYGKITDYTESPQGRFHGREGNDALFDYTLTLTTTDHDEVIPYD